MLKAHGMTLLVAGLLAAAYAAPLAAEGPSKKIRVFVVVAAPKSEFADTRTEEREQAARDLRESIQKKRKDWLELADTAATADVRIEVVDRFFRDSGRVESNTTATASTNKKGDQAYGTSSTSQRNVQLYVLQTTLVVGDHREELEGAVPDTYMFGGPWRTAANQVTEEVEKFARTNYDKLLTRRAR